MENDMTTANVEHTFRVGNMVYYKIVACELEEYVGCGVLRGEPFTIQFGNHDDTTHIFTKLHGEEKLPSNSMVIIGQDITSIDDSWHLQVYVDTDTIVNRQYCFMTIDEGHVKNIA